MSTVFLLRQLVIIFCFVLLAFGEQSYPELTPTETSIFCICDDLVIISTFIKQLRSFFPPNFIIQIFKYWENIERIVQWTLYIYHLNPVVIILLGWFYITFYLYIHLSIHEFQNRLHFSLKYFIMHFLRIKNIVLYNQLSHLKKLAIIPSPYKLL